MIPLRFGNVLLWVQDDFTTLRTESCVSQSPSFNPQTLERGCGCVSRNDNDQKHTAKATKERLEKKHIKVRDSLQI